MSRRCAMPRRRPGLITLNLGTGTRRVGAGRGESLRARQRPADRLRDRPRRPGDVPAYWGDPSLAEATLGWRARRGLDAMCADSWRWQQGNPRGYE